MDIKLSVAVIRSTKLQAVQKRLQEIGLGGISVSRVKGYGEYQDFFTQDGMVDEVRIEIFTRSGQAQAITSAILDAAHTGLPGDGIVAVIPTERLYLVRTRSEPSPGDSWPVVER